MGVSAAVDAMYQYSLSWFLELFHTSLRLAEPDADQDQQHERRESRASVWSRCGGASRGRAPAYESVVP